MLSLHVATATPQWRLLDRFVGIPAPTLLVATLVAHGVALAGSITPCSKIASARILAHALRLISLNTHLLTAPALAPCLSIPVVGKSIATLLLLPSAVVVLSPLDLAKAGTGLHLFLLVVRITGTDAIKSIM